MDWCAVLSQNLRHLRNVGNDPAAISSLTENATATLLAVYARNGWGEPPTALEGVQPLG
jgi:hypothetical protein